jgi:hypothetical protein
MLGADATAYPEPAIEAAATPAEPRIFNSLDHKFEPVIDGGIEPGNIPPDGLPCTTSTRRSPSASLPGREGTCL